MFAFEKFPTSSHQIFKPNTRQVLRIKQMNLKHL